jgi:hypothetical protein
MVWGCFSYHGTGRLVFIEGTMDKYQYVEILVNNLRASASEMGLSEFIFQQDNDPKHTSKHTKGFFEEMGIDVLPWPSQSPDLNPIEHIWALIKRRLSGKVCRSREQLKEALQREWALVTKEYCMNLIDSMPRRIRSVLTSNGGHTLY